MTVAARGWWRSVWVGMFALPILTGCPDPAATGSTDADETEHLLSGPRHPITAEGRMVGWLAGDSALVGDSLVLFWEPRLRLTGDGPTVEARTARKSLGESPVRFVGGVVVRSPTGRTRLEADSVEFDPASGRFTPELR